METTLDAPRPPAAPTRTHAARIARPRRATGKILFGVIAGIAVLAWSARAAWHAYRYETTDDAYVTGHLIQIAPQIEGQVASVAVADNQAVKAGDVLVRLDPLQFDLAVRKARAAVEQARAQAGQTRAAAQQAEAQVTEAEARARQAEAQRAQTTAQLELARLTLGRTEQLFSKGGVNSQADVDNARATFKAAEAADAANDANVKAANSAAGSAQAQLVSARAQIAAAEASVAVAEAAVADAERQLSYATLKAPSDGRVGNRLVEAGNHVLSGQQLLSLAAPDPWIVANFKETQLARMRDGQQVEIEVDAAPGVALHGVIDSLAPASGAQFALLPPDNATGNFNKVVQRVPVKIVLDAASRAALGDRLRLGLSAVVRVRVR
ncbi:MAG TPA: HlyD family secretion protein [Candidatus Didemnitutus sp.]|nr:HlyD family secretion protein [Candidatus Didemnitutus sp.]